MEENKTEKFSIGSVCHLGNAEKFFIFSRCPKTYHKTIKKAIEEIRKIDDDSTAEDCFFSHLIEPDNNIGQQLWRYMPLSSFKKLCELGTITMSSIISMNDKSETCYASSYISSYIGDEFHEESENPTDIFINSFSTKKDNLLMWYMYAGMAKGVALRFDNKIQEGNFTLHSVDYSKDKTKDGTKQMHMSLNYLKNMLNQKAYSVRLKRWNIWQHFFKPSYYRDEAEIRLLLLGKGDEDKKKEWITSSNNIHFPILKYQLFDYWGNNNSEYSKLDKYPLELKEIMLGPLYDEPEANKLTLRNYFHEMTKGKFSNITVSSIDNYRG